MQGSSPARLYATLVGGILLVVGIVGFFYGSSFGSPGKVDELFGLLDTNGWLNLLHLLTGALGLLMAGYGARQYAIGLGVVYVVIAVWGFVIGSGAAMLGLIPLDAADNVAHLILGLLGIGAGIVTPSAGGGPAQPLPAPAVQDRTV
ncbi:MAG: DUF4383 domain-containing protein [Solirubrobacterales bacterium]